jgi:hypothetical protein
LRFGAYAPGEAISTDIGGQVFRFVVRIARLFYSMDNFWDDAELDVVDPLAS